MPVFKVTANVTLCEDLQSSTPLHYRAVDGEMFRMPCKTWFRVEGSEKEIHHYDQFKAEAKHSGNYTCLIR